MMQILILLFFSAFAQARELTLDQTSTAPHLLEIVTSGTDALRLFLREIESAQHSIDIETYVAKDEESFWLILNTARQRIRQGVQVRLSLDWYGSRLNRGTLSREQLCSLIADGFQIGFFNPKLHQIFKRNHRKLVIVDKQSVSSGGRNFSNLNFGLNDIQNRLDYTFTLRGEIAEMASRSFEDYWNSAHVVQMPSCSGSESVIYPDTDKLMAELFSQPFSPQTFNIEHVRFLSDPPAKSPSAFMSSLYELFATSNSAIVETPDLYLGLRLSGMLKSYLAQRKSLAFLTNPPTRFGSLLSHINGDYSLIKQGAQSWVKDAIFSQESAPLLDPFKKAAKWTKHNKAIIFDNKHVLLSSFNFNLLSEYSNAEAGFYFRNAPNLVEYLKSLYRTRPYQPRTCDIWG